jgi:hypothetical protein
MIAGERPGSALPVASLCASPITISACVERPFRCARDPATARALGSTKQQNGRKKQEGRAVSPHVVYRVSAFAARRICAIKKTAASRCIEMSNDNIIALTDADAVPVRALADHLRMHPVNVVKDLKSRGYALGSIRGATGQWTKALARGDAERYLAERRSSLPPSADVEGEGRRLERSETTPALREGETGTP